MNDELVIYADFMSQPSRAVLSLCYALRLKFKLVEVRVMKGETLSEEFKKISPSETVPTMVHGSLTLYESAAIMTYICDTFGQDSSWYPTDFKTRANIDNYLHWHHGNIRFGCGMHVFNKYAAKKYYGRELEGLDQIATDKRNEAFSVLNGILQKRKYICTHVRPTIADLACYAEIAALMWIRVGLGKFKALERWMEDIGNIQEVRKAHEVFFKLSPRVKL